MDSALYVVPKVRWGSKGPEAVERFHLLLLKSRSTTKTNQPIVF